MRHAGTQPLETDRLLLRRLLPQDAGMMYRNWASDPQVTRFLRWEPHRDLQETAELLTAWACLYPNPDYYQWCLVEKATGEVFGSIGIFRAAPEQKAFWPELNTADGVWEVGYCIGKRWWNKGFTTEALQAVVDYWFTQTDAPFLTCCYAMENPASGRVMEKAGFVFHHNGIDHRFDGTPVECRYCVLTRKAPPWARFPPHRGKWRSQKRERLSPQVTDEGTDLQTILGQSSI